MLNKFLMYYQSIREQKEKYNEVKKAQQPKPGRVRVLCGKTFVHACELIDLEEELAVLYLYSNIRKINLSQDLINSIIRVFPKETRDIDFNSLTTVRLFNALNWIIYSYTVSNVAYIDLPSKYHPPVPPNLNKDWELTKVGLSYHFAKEMRTFFNHIVYDDLNR